MLQIIKGNLFASKCQTLVNTVNCKGVMGKGIALEFRLRNPAMYERYRRYCLDGQLTIGKLWLYKPPSEEQHWVLNFPTKDHWKYPSKLQYLRAGLEKFVATHRDRGIKSIAFPTLGSHNGGIPEQDSIELMREYLEGVDIDVEIYKFDEKAGDGLYQRLVSEMAHNCEDRFRCRTGLSAPTRSGFSGEQLRIQRFRQSASLRRQKASE